MAKVKKVRKARMQKKQATRAKALRVTIATIKTEAAEAKRHITLSVDVETHGIIKSYAATKKVDPSVAAAMLISIAQRRLAALTRYAKAVE